MAAIRLSSLCSNLLTWRHLAILLALLNIKSLPLAWHIRLIHYVLRSIRLAPKKHPNSNKTSIPALFQTHTLTTFSPPAEIDYNLHKSNSTYFTDVDISRAALITSLLSPGFTRLRTELTVQGHQRGSFKLILGAVHASFRREIGVNQRYEVKSRLVGWDGKWLVIGSWFVRPTTKRVGVKERKPGEVLASVVSKYVVKKGRFTVKPEWCLRCAGLLPDRPVGEEAQNVLEVERQNGTINDVDVDESTTGLLRDVVEWDTETSTPSMSAEPKTSMQPETETGHWDWNRIERERQRGLEVVQGWLALDGELSQEFSRF